MRRGGERALSSALALTAALLVLSTSPAPAQSPAPGGEVPSTLALSLTEPGPFKRIGKSQVFATTIRAEATATVIPAKLSLADGDVGPAHRRGYLGRGASLLPLPLQASAEGGPRRSLADLVPALLRVWRVPVSAAPARIRVLQRAPSARAVRGRQKTLLLTLTAGAP